MPGGSVSEPRGAIGLQTAKLSPISGNVTGATAQLPAPVQSHPYSDMSAADLNAEPTGTLGLTADERALMDGHYGAHRNMGTREAVHILDLSTRISLHRAGRATRQRDKLQRQDS
jgi:hypothetical protein